jgi:hypothetical protein
MIKSKAKLHFGPLPQIYIYIYIYIFLFFLNKIGKEVPREG